MAKYSTGGGGGGGGGDACELCGAASEDLRTATVAGAELQVCPECAPHSDRESTGGGGGSGPGSGSSSGGDRERQRRQQTARNAARVADAAGGDSSHWEEGGVDYEEDRLPYLVRDYGKTVQQARQEEGLQREELATEIDADENDILAVEQGRATQANVGGSVVRALEQRLDVDLVKE
jgi:ribosome-binding protein aMBF1 (putative translation factor)